MKTKFTLLALMLGTLLNSKTQLFASQNTFLEPGMNLGNPHIGLDTDPLVESHELGWICVGLDQINQVDRFGKTPLMLAVENGQDILVKELIGANADVNQLAYNGETALTLATKNCHGHVSILQHLLEAGADVNHQAFNRETALLRAAKNGDSSIVTALLEHTIDTPHQGARSWSEVSVAVDVNNARSDGATPLIMAAGFGYGKIVDDLLTAKADVNQVMDHGVTALIMAISLGHEESVKSLIRANADVNQAMTNGVTPLSRTKFNRCETIAQILINAGAQ